MARARRRVAMEVLAARGLSPDKSRGQHFLVDPNTARKIVRLAGVTSGRSVLEIGPGLGALTEELVAAGANVVAVEIDPEMCGIVGDLGVQVVEADAMKINIDDVCVAGSSLVANLPYNVATPLMLKVLADVRNVVDGLVMVQQEVAQRWVAKPGSKQRGAVSMKMQYFASLKIVGAVNKTVFLPPPKVMSRLVSFVRHQPEVNVDVRRLFAVCVAAFAHRRKTAVNSLRDEGYDADAVRAVLKNRELNGSVRATELTLQDFSAIAEALPEC